MSIGNAEKSAPVKTGFNDTAFFNSMKDTMDSHSGEGNDKASNFIQRAIEEERDSQSTTKNNDDDSIEAIKQRYSASSAEAKRLKAELDREKERIKSLEPFNPIVEAMQNDPGLVEHIRNYANKQEKVARNPMALIKEELGLSDDFIMDMEDATNDPSSDSAKVLRGMIRLEAKGLVNENNERLSKETSEQVRKSKIDQEKKELKKRYNLSDSDISELDEWANNNELTYDMLFQLKNLGSRDKNVISKILNDKTSQREKMGMLPKSLGSTSSSSEAQSDDDVIFEAIKKTVNPGGLFKQ